MHPQTIEDFLVSSDPAIAWKNTGSGHSMIKDPIVPLAIRKWRDFDLATMKTMSGGIFQDVLNQEYDFGRCSRHGGHTHFIQTSYEAPSNEKSLDFVLEKTIKETVSCALSKSQDYLRNVARLQLPAKNLQMIHGCEAQNLGDETSYDPDWAGIYRATVADDARNLKDSQDLLGDKELRAPNLPLNYLPGDSKLRQKVNGQTLPNEGRFDSLKKNDGVRHALEQISTYCYHARSRYGYIISETQLIVVRLRPGSGAQSRNPDDIMKGLKNEALLEYRLIGYHPHSNQRNPALTASLALWWLHLLAVVDNSIDWRYQPLAEMNVFRVRESSVLSQRYSPPPDSQFEDPLPTERRPPPRKADIKRRRSTKGLSGPTSKSRQRQDEEDDGLQYIPTPPSSTGKPSKETYPIPPTNRTTTKEPPRFAVITGRLTRS